MRLVLIIAQVEPLHRLMACYEMKKTPHGCKLVVAEGLLKGYSAVSGWVALADVGADGNVGPVR